MKRCRDCSTKILGMNVRCDACKRTRRNAAVRDYHRRIRSTPEGRQASRDYNNAQNRKHPERNSRIGKSWRQRNPDKVKAYNLKRKHRAQEFGGYPPADSGLATPTVPRLSSPHREECQPAPIPGEPA